MRAAWFRYLDTVGETRPALYRYCRRMTGNVWDAEDLLQDTLLKGFGAIGRGDATSKPAHVKGPRAYLFRIATNLWIDQMRRRHLITSNLPGSDDSSTGERSIEALEAASLLLSRVAPQERAAVVLKEVFDFTLEQIAEILSTTVAAVKSALHRGRARLEEIPGMPRVQRAPSKELLDRFVAVSFQGEWLLVVWAGAVSHEVLINVERLEEEAGHVAHIRSYYFCPEVIAEIAGEIGAKAWASPHGQNQPPHTQSELAASAILPWS